jgi:hypothetical protein
MVMSRLRILLALVLGAGSCSVALAQQPVRHLPRVGRCPLGYYSSGNCCIKSR